MRTPILETQRLLLRPMCVADAESAFANWTSDPEIARFMRWERHENLAQTREWLASEEVLVESDAVYNWGIVLKETGMLIGSAGLVYIEEKGMYELGYNVMKACWGRGVATEAAQEILLFAIKELKQSRFYCCHAKDNPASGRVMEKVGFQYQRDGEYRSWNGERRFAAREYLLIAE